MKVLRHREGNLRRHIEIEDSGAKEFFSSDVVLCHLREDMVC